ncbi:purine permease [Mycoplasmatota bacterium]|nr:purine permease [Mycoplasmatota bacterium]
MSEKNIAFQLNGKPSLKVAVPLGLQHILAMFTSNLAPIIILAGVIGVSVDDKIYLIQMAMFASGVATLVQVFPIGNVGARLPIVMGTSFSFLSIAVVAGIKYGLPGVFGAALAGSIVEITLGYVLPSIRKYFPPIVTGIVVLAIGLSLLNVGANYFAGSGNPTAPGYGSGQNLLLGTIVLLTMIGFSTWGKGMWKTSAVLIGIIVGYIVASFMGLVDFSAIANAKWLTFPVPLKYGLEFHWDAIALFGAMYIITAIETVGDCSGVTMGGLNREATKEELRGSILADGFGSAFAALFNALPNTSFSQNVGIVAMTKVVNRFIVAVGALFLVAGAFIPKFGAIFSVIPNAALGGVLIMIFAMIAVSGIRMITMENLDGRAGLILALSLGVGFGIASTSTFVNALDPDLFSGILKPVFGLLHWFFSDRVVASGLLAFILNMILPKDTTVEA